VRAVSPRVPACLVAPGASGSTRAVLTPDVPRADQRAGALTTWPCPGEVRTHRAAPLPGVAHSACVRCWDPAAGPAGRSAPRASRDRLTGHASTVRTLAPAVLIRCGH